MTFADWMSFVQTVVIVLGGIVAARGVDAWRHEMVGRRRAELSEDTLAMFYEAQMLIQRARFPGSYQSEGRSRPLQEGESEEKRSRYLDALYVPVERIDGDAEFWSRFDAARLRYRAVFGVPAAQPFEKFRDIRIQVMLSANSLIRDARREERGAKRTEADRTRIEKYEADIGWGDPDTDEIKKEIERAVGQIEATCRPAIDGYNAQRRELWKLQKRVT